MGLAGRIRECRGGECLARGGLWGAVVGGVVACVSGVWLLRCGRDGL